MPSTALPVVDVITEPGGTLSVSLELPVVEVVVANQTLSPFTEVEGDLPEASVIVELQTLIPSTTSVTLVEIPVLELFVEAVEILASLGLTERLQGQTELPAAGIFVVSQPDGRILEFGEEIIALAGVPFEGFWISPSLGREEFGEVSTLTRVLFNYKSEEATQFDVKASGDGGETWEESVTVSVPLTNGRVGRVNAFFVTSGDDLRFEVRFRDDTSPSLQILRYTARIVKRSSYVI